MTWNPKLSDKILWYWSGDLQMSHHPVIGRLVYRCSAWRSSYKTGKRLGLDWTLTTQDQKIERPIKTTTAVWSSVHQHFKILKTEKTAVWLVSTSLSILTDCIFVLKSQTITLPDIWFLSNAKEWEPNAWLHENVVPNTKRCPSHILKIPQEIIPYAYYHLNSCQRNPITVP